MARALALGFLVGFPIAVSPGPIFFLVLRRTLAGGWRSGLVPGLGVATGDAAYAAIAAFGVAAVTTFRIAERRWIGLVGGIAILIIGIRTIVIKQQAPTLPSPRGGGVVRARGRDVPTVGRKDLRQGRDYVSILALTLSNPSTILSFTAVFAGLGLHVAGGLGPALALVVGVWLGSVAWWILLTGFGLASGIALVGFGVIAIGAALRR
jgi:threonine/homoserine/homoserine lactone efflux protein